MLLFSSRYLFVVRRFWAESESVRRGVNEFITESGKSIVAAVEIQYNSLILLTFVVLQLLVSARYLFVVRRSWVKSESVLKTELSENRRRRLSYESMFMNDLNADLKAYYIVE